MAIFNGTSKNDELSGGDGNDSITGLAGNDKLAGGSGNDTLDGGDGNDELAGGSGNDVLVAGAGNDKVDGGEGDDRLDGGDGNDDITAGSGNDSLTGAGGNDKIDGGSGNDFIDSGDGNDDITAGSGNDSISGGDGNDKLDAGDGNDSIVGGDGNDNIVGGAGNDTLGGGAGNDKLEGGDGNDMFVVTAADLLNGNNDSYVGGAGTDTLRFDLTAAEWARADIKAAVANLQGQLASSGIEAGQTYVDGVLQGGGGGGDTTPPAAPTVALASDTGASTTDKITSNGTLNVTPAEAGGTIQYSINGGTSWTTSFTAAQGANAVQVRQVDAAGNNGAATSFSFTLDTAAPNAPTVALTSDTGNSAADKITKVGTLNVTPAESGGSIQYSTNGGSTWTSSFAATEGANSVQVRQIDVAGNTSAATSFSFTLDTAAANAPTVALTSDTGSSGSDKITKVGTLAVSGTESGAAVEYSINGGTSWTNSFTAAEGANSVQVRQTDAAGNTSAATSFSFTLDTAAPTAPTVSLTSDTGSSAADKITKAGTLAVSGTESGAAVEYSTNGGSSWNSSFAAAEGANSVQVRQTDAAGNTSTATNFSFTLDTAAPNAPTVALTSDTGSSAADKITKAGTLAVSGTESGAAVEYSTNGGTSWTSSFSAAEGANSVQVRQTDAAGNTSAATSFNFTLDTVAPTAPTVALGSDTGSSAADKITKVGTLAVSGTESGAAIEYSTNGGTSWSNSFAAAEGANNVQVRQTDAAGNTSAATSFNFTLDTAAPNAPTVALSSDTGSSASDGITKTGTLAIGGTEAGAAVEYSINGGTSWASSFAAVEGANSVQVRQTDAAGNTSAATSFSFTLDTAAPTAPTVALTSDTGSSASDGITKTGTLAIGGTESGAAVEYSTNGGSTWASSFAAAAEGANSVQVRQTDAAGNSSAATSFNFTLDTASPTAPTVALTSDTGSSASDGITKTGTLAIGGTEAGAAVEYSTNGGTSWTSSFAAAEGTNNVQVRQTDAAGNTSAASSFSFTLDTAAPGAPTVALTSDTGSSGSDGITKTGTLAIGGTESGAAVEYSTNGGSSWTSSFAATEGANSVQVRQTDAAGNTSAATSFSFTLDTAAPTAPSVALTSDTGSSNSDGITRTGTLAIGGTEAGAAVEYSTNGGTSWTNSFAASEGANSVQVRQTDAAGNTSAATSFNFTLDTAAPGAPTVALTSDTGSSASDGISKTGTLAIGGTEAGAAVEYSTNGGSTWASSFAAAEGANSVQVRQTDAAGNSSAATSFNFTLDTAAPSAPMVALTSDTGSSNSDGITKTGTLAIGGTESGAAVEYSTNGGTNWTNSFSAAEGANSVQVRQTDAAGNTSAATSFAFTLDTAAPSAPTVALTSDTGSSNSDGITKTGTLAIGGTEVGAAVEYSTNGGSTWNSSFAAAEGANSVQVRQTDAAGNTSAATSFAFTLDTASPTAPTVALTSDTGSSGSDGLTKTGTLAIGGTEAGAAVEYSINGGTSWASSFAAAEGANSVQVRQTDAAGNTSAATSFAFTLDTASPTAPTVALTSDTGSSSSDGITSNGTLALGGTEAGAAVEYSTNGGTSWTNSFAAAEGANSVQVRQTDAAGNTSVATSFNFTLDTTSPSAPTVALISDTGSSNGDAFTNDGRLAIDAEAGARIEYSIDGGTSWSESFTAIEGANDIRVRQTDVAGNTSAASRFSFALDTDPPGAANVRLANDTGVSNTDLITSDGRLAIPGLRPSAPAEYSIDNGATWTSSFVASEGVNTVLVRLVDRAGNASPVNEFNLHARYQRFGSDRRAEERHRRVEQRRAHQRRPGHRRCGGWREGRIFDRQWFDLDEQLQQGRRPQRHSGPSDRRCRQHKHRDQLQLCTRQHNPGGADRRADQRYRLVDQRRDHQDRHARHRRHRGGCCG